jgi:hypothetical protein
VTREKKKEMEEKYKNKIGRAESITESQNIQWLSL